MYSNLTKVNFKQAYETLLLSAKTKTPVLMIGDPGIGKSALAEMVASEMGLPCEVLIGSTCDPIDIGGVPFLSKDSSRVERFPISVIREACEKPVVLFLDELFGTPMTVQAAMLRLILERRVGDYKLHPDTVVLAAANPPEQSPGGYDPSPPLINRFCVVRLRPNEEEVLSYFENLFSPQTDPVLWEKFNQFSSVTQIVSNILQIDMPTNCVADPKPWGSPRAWEKALRVLAAAETSSVDALPAIKGLVGVEQAMAFHAIYKLREKVPSIDQIVENPQKTRIPSDKDAIVAVLCQILPVARKNIWAAWIYLDKLKSQEYKTICAKQICHVYCDSRLPFYSEGKKIRQEVLKNILG